MGHPKYDHPPRGLSNFDDFLKEQEVRITTHLSAVAVRLRQAKQEEEDDSDPFKPACALLEVRK